MTSQTDVLLPCPLCSADAELDTQQSYRHISTGRLETGIAVYCRECGVQAMLCRGDLPDLQPEEVIAIWNRRPDLVRTLSGARHALRSYEFGNASPDLAKSIADAIDLLIGKGI